MGIKEALSSGLQGNSQQCLRSQQAPPLEEQWKIPSCKTLPYLASPAEERRKAGSSWLSASLFPQEEEQALDKASCAGCREVWLLSIMLSQAAGMSGEGEQTRCSLRRKCSCCRKLRLSPPCGGQLGEVKGHTSCTAGFWLSKDICWPCQPICLFLCLQLSRFSATWCLFCIFFMLKGRYVMQIDIPLVQCSGILLTMFFGLVVCLFLDKGGHALWNPILKMAVLPFIPLECIIM